MDIDAALKEAHKLSERASQQTLCPQAAEYHYNKSFPEFREGVADLQGSIRKVLLSCQAAVAPNGSKSAPVSVDWEDANEVREWVSCVLDDCMEGVDAALDRHRQAVRQKALQEEGAEQAGTEAPTPVLPSQLGPVSNIGGAAKGLVRNMPSGRIRPQEYYGLPVDNSPQPFQHWAPHLAAVLPSTSAPLSTELKHQHPFTQALDQLSYSSENLDASVVFPPRPLEETPLAFVDTPQELATLVSELQGVQHLAIDLEHHSYRSFQGFTCLMQLSTRTKDYIIDTLALRQHIGPALVSIFANPDIVKVLHGADHDVLWLQRDFHLYLVNMFDTGQASRVLSYPSNSFAYLLEHFCGVKADKRFQLADWRARPLTPEMLEYARGDTHYLLYCYDRLKQELANMGGQVPPSLQVQGGPQPPQAGNLGIATVLERSRRLCLACYKKEQPPTEQSCEDMVQRWEVSLNSLQRQVLFAAAQWRDAVCRELDEGIGYVLPRSQLITLAQQMPGTAKDLLRLLGRSASEPVKSRVHALAACISNAKTAAAAATAAKEACAAGAAAPVLAADVGRTVAGAYPAAATARCITAADNQATRALAELAPLEANAPALPSTAQPGVQTGFSWSSPPAGTNQPELLAPASSTQPDEPAMQAGVITGGHLAPKPVAPIKSKPVASIKSKAGCRGLFGGGNAPKKLRAQGQVCAAGSLASGQPATLPLEDCSAPSTFSASAAAEAPVAHTKTQPLAGEPEPQASVAPTTPQASASDTGAQAAHGSGPAPLLIRKPVAKGRKSRGSLAGLLGSVPKPPQSQQQESEPAAHASTGAPGQAGTTVVSDHPSSEAVTVVSALPSSEAGSGADEGVEAGGGGKQLVAQLKASLALPFPVLNLPPPDKGYSEGLAARHGACREQSQQAGQAGQQQQQHDQVDQQHDEEQCEEVRQPDTRQPQTSQCMDFVPIPRKKTSGGGQHGVLQVLHVLPRVTKDALKRKYIDGQGGQEDDGGSEASAR